MQQDRTKEPEIQYKNGAISQQFNVKALFLMFLKTILLFAFAAFAISAPTPKDEWKTREFQNFQQLKKKLLGLNYNVEATFCTNGKYDFDYVGPLQFFEFHHSFYTLHLLSVKNKIEQIGWDISEFFCESAERPGQKRSMEDCVHEKKARDVEGLKKRYKAIGGILWPSKRIYDIIQDAFKDLQERTHE